ncbi:bifunctional 2-polyprenyl-6-hydroxyphenol methylase/3-demethylubiquinol 3-O-methyltransferase UbiG [Roseomonas sp. 18066]|uniref:class I SAM-dependent methyltransferase n=1 Tax=Roseomonas sp. 18066 TaxID=2681412 RepID=UPI001356C401|nr:class I SAM-dependent methyltransferase [Roseomonas sp. 18066]
MSQPADALSIPSWYRDATADSRMTPGHDPVWRQMIAHIPEQDLAAATVLDYGCGQGGLLRLLHALRPFRAGLGVDVARDAVARAEALSAGLPLAFDTPSALAGQPARFDLALSHEVIYLLPDLEAHAAEIRAALRRGGVYYAVTGCHTGNPMWPRWRALVAEITHTTPQDFSLDDFHEAFAAAGFEVSARQFRFEGFVPLKPGAWTKTVEEALRYVTETKTMFRFRLPR